SVDKKEKSKGEDDEISFVEADLRSDFKDAIYWSPSVETDANGYVAVKVKFPDNLTTWRITSRVITGDTKVGQMVNTVITRKDLLVRMETPRFFQQNDEVTISTIIHNYLNEDKQTKLSLKVENLQLEDGQKEQVITVGKNEEKRIDWKVKVTEPVGFAKLTATALTNQESDAVEVKVPLQPHGLQLAQYLSMDIADVNKTEIKNINIPEYTDLRSTKLKLNVAASLASTMLTALDELVGYPYGCVEQTMSRFLPTVIVANAFRDLNAPISEATQKDLPKMVEAGFNRLYSMQHYDGGWGWWTNDQSHPFMTSYVIYGLALGQSAGYNVRKDVLNKGITVLKSQLKDKNIDATTRAYMLYSLSYVENKDTKLFEEQFQILSEQKLNDYAVGLISMAASNIGDNETARKFNEILIKDVQDFGEAGAYWGGQVFKYQWQDDKVQTTAMAVKALVASPNSFKDNPEILNKAIRWLMMQRQGAGWWNTQQTAFIIYAMVDYLKTSKELEPDYNVKIFVNNELLMDKHMTKDDIFRKEGNFVIEGNKLKAGANEIRIEKNGTGKVYVASHTTYYTNEEKINPRENGFRVEKEYFKLEKYTHYNDEKITYKKRYFDGKIKSGDEILVKVKVSTKEQNLQYFMLEDPIPAGCEVIKDDWAYTIDEEKDYTGWDYYWWRWWYADKDIRDNRVTFFATYLYGDTYEFSYILRAQIPGVYNVIPATGMLMYYPDVRGSSEELKIEIED
ncbi:MAG: alpha-2-macroglobulin family protein, partial [Ignavibacteria bacterium]